MGGRVQGWRRLNWHERACFAGLAFLLAPIHILLATAGYARTRLWLERLSNVQTARQTTSGELDQARRLAERASMAGRHGLVDATCLRQSLLVHFLLRRKGLAPKLMIGVRRRDEVFDAHAWVELDGIALGQAELAHAPLPAPEMQQGAA